MSLNKSVTLWMIRCGSSDIDFEFLVEFLELLFKREDNKHGNNNINHCFTLLENSGPWSCWRILELRKWDISPVDNPVFLLKSWFWVVERLQTWSNNKQSRLCAEILEWFGTYCTQDQFRNDTMVLREVEWAEVPFVAEVVEQLKFDTHDTSLST